MKKIITSFIVIALLAMSLASALVTYTGQPQFPYIIYGFVDWQSQALGGARIELTNVNTGYSTIIKTNIDGYWQEDGSNWQTTSSARPPVLFGDTLKVKTLDGCGTNDVCEKTFSAFGSGFENSALVDLKVSGVIVTSEGSSSGSGSSSGGGGGGGGGSSPAWTCEAWTKCSEGKQTKLCRLGEFTSKETRACVPEPTPVVVTEPTQPTEPETPTEPEPETYVCTDGTIVSNLNECLETPEQVKEYIWQKTGVQVGASAIGIGFIALVIYWVKRNRARAAKMVNTRVENLKKK